MSKFRTLELAKEFYRSTRHIKLPTHLKDQFLRSSSSISLNLAEGNAKMSEKEKLRFYEIAHGSFREAMTILEIEDISTDSFGTTADNLGASLFNLTRSLAEKKTSSKVQK